MKDIGDIIIDKLHERRELVRTELHKRYKNIKPFRMEPVSNDMNIYIYENMTSQDLEYAITTYGRDDVNTWLYECEKARIKGRENAQS